MSNKQPQTADALGELIVALQACIATARALQVEELMREDAPQPAPKPARPAKRETAPERGDPRPANGPPRTGKGLFAALCHRSEESGERDLVKKVQEWGAKKNWPDRMVDWTDAQAVEAWNAFERREAKRTAPQPTQRDMTPIPLSELCGNRRFTVWLEDFCEVEGLAYWRFVNHLVKFAAQQKFWRVADPSRQDNQVKVDWLDRAEAHFAALIAETRRYRDEIASTPE